MASTAISIVVRPRGQHAHTYPCSIRQLTIYFVQENQSKTCPKLSQLVLKSHRRSYSSALPMPPNSPSID